MLGREEAKELLVAVPQDDVERFADHLDQSNCRLRGATVSSRRTASGDTLVARLTSIDPRGSSELMHAALSAAAGGPLVVKPAVRSEETAENRENKCELISPVFQGKAALTADDSLRLSAGQLVTVSFRTQEEPIAMRIYRSLKRWIERIVQAPNRCLTCLMPSVTGKLLGAEIDRRRRNSLPVPHLRAPELILGAAIL